MAELVLLTVSRAEVDATHQRAAAGDGAAPRASDDLWAPYPPLTCVLRLR